MRLNDVRKHNQSFVSVPASAVPDNNNNGYLLHANSPCYNLMVTNYRNIVAKPFLQLHNIDRTSLTIPLTQQHITKDAFKSLIGKTENVSLSSRPESTDIIRRAELLRKGVPKKTGRS